jgi:hypothetical protein
MAEQFPPVKINLTPVKVAGLAGVPLLAVVGAIAFVFPIARWLLVLGASSGALLSLLLIHLHRRRGADPGSSSPIPPRFASALADRDGSRSPRRENGSPRLAGVTLPLLVSQGNHGVHATGL